MNAFTGSLGFVTGDLAEFELNLISVSGLLNSSRKEVESFGAAMRDMAKRVGYSAKDLSRSLFDVVSAQVDLNQQMDLLEKSAQLARVGMSDLNGAVKLSINAIKAFNIETADLNDVFSKLFKAQKYGKTTIKELGDSFGTVAGIASVMNITYHETLAILATLTQKGQDTTIAATGLRNIINQLLSPSESIKNILHGMGLATGEAALQGKGLAETLIKLNAYLETYNYELTDAFNNVRGVNSVALLFNDGGEKMIEIINATKEETSEFSEAVKLAEQSIAQRWGKVSATIESSTIGIGNIIKEFWLVPLEGVAFALKQIERTYRDILKAASGKMDMMSFIEFMGGYTGTGFDFMKIGMKLKEFSMRRTEKFRRKHIKVEENVLGLPHQSPYDEIYARRKGVFPTADLSGETVPYQQHFYADKYTPPPKSDLEKLRDFYSEESKAKKSQQDKAASDEQKALDSIEKKKKAELAAEKARRDALLGYAKLDHLVQSKRLSSALKLGKYLVQIDQQVTKKKILNSLSDGFAAILAGNPLTAAVKFGILASQIAPLLGAVSSFGGITGAFKLNKGGVIRGSMDGDRYPAVVGQGEAYLERETTNNIGKMAKDYVSGEGFNQQPIELTVNLNSKVIAKEVYRDTLGLQREGVLNGKNL